MTVVKPKILLTNAFPVLFFIFLDSFCWAGFPFGLIVCCVVFIYLLSSVLLIVFGPFIAQCFAWFVLLFWWAVFVWAFSSLCNSIAQNKILRGILDHEAVWRLFAFCFGSRALGSGCQITRERLMQLWPLDPQAFSSPSTQVFIY